MGIYGDSNRIDPPSLIEQHVGQVIRQVQPQRVIESATLFQAVVAIAFSSTDPFESLTDAGGANAVNWNAEHIDVSALHDNVTNNDRFTIPAGKAGRYKVSARLIFNSNGNSDGTRILRIFVNTTEVTSKTVTNAGSGTDTIVMHVWEQFMREGDYFQIQAEITGTGTVTLEAGTVDKSYCTVVQQLI